MILKRNPKRKHQVVLLLLQIPIESTPFFLFSPSVSFSPQILLSVDYIFYSIYHIPSPSSSPS